MGQVLGFSHCQEYGSVASTPDSTPPCTDGGNEESEIYELQTAREWSDDEETADPDDDEGQASSSSIWGTPRQNSFELTFSYIAIAEAEAVGASRQHRERRRGGHRGSRTPLIQTDTLEMLLDSPDVDWDPQVFLDQEEEEGLSESREQERVEPRTACPFRRTDREQSGTVTNQPSPQNMDTETQRSDTGVQRETVQPSSLIQHRPSATVQAEAASLTQKPDVTTETVSVKLLTSVRPADQVGSSPAAVGFNSQEQLVTDQWFSALNLIEEPTVWAVIDLIYWKDTERTGMVLTGLVVGLLSLFQLSIITVISTVSLAVMCFTISVRVYYQFLYILSWGDGEHPFKSYLQQDISFGGEQADLFMQWVIVMALSAAESLKRLFFVGNLFESLKFLFLMYLVTYLGDLSNGLTLLIISLIAVFSLPLFYKQHQEEVDGFIAKIQARVDSIKDFLQRLVQGGGPPPDPTPGGAKPKAQCTLDDNSKRS
uniref:Reticulon n=1 Tax=Nothobranchius korthausae TaxID=1143690 RepID=A0A1A8H4Q1_9TELE